MNKHSKIFKVFTVLIAVIISTIGVRTDVFAAQVNVTTTYTCPKSLCLKKLIVNGPYGDPDGKIDSDIPYLGGRTYKDVFLNEYLNIPERYNEFHLYVIYCPKYDYSDSVYTRHTMTLMFSHHGYTIKGYTQYSETQHYVNKKCDHGVDLKGTNLYALSQTLCGSNAMIKTDDMEGLVDDYQSQSGCGKESAELESHSWIYGAWSDAGNGKHTRTKTCSKCGYTATETASHSLSNGAWTADGASGHKRTVRCSTCGYSTVETAAHTGSVEYSCVDETNHSRTEKCTVCGYSDSTTEAHNLTYSDWEKYGMTSQLKLDKNAPDSGKYHVRTVKCSDCGYTKYEYALHEEIREPADPNEYWVGTWSTYGDTHHYYRICTVCGHKTDVYNQHTYNESDTVYDLIDENSHHTTQTCNKCGWVNEFDENHTLHTEYNVLSDTEHEKVITCTKCDYETRSTGAHHNDDSDCYCDECGYLMTKFSVTVPATMYLVMAKDGSVYSADNAEIINNSTAAVSVKEINIEGQNNWRVVPYTTDMANQKVDSKLIGFSIRDQQTMELGKSTVFYPGDDWNIAKGASLPLPYNAIVSATSNPIENKQVLNITFVVDWSDS